jgi:threonine/homoserine/homoserine lactone efflux protein
MVAWANTVAFCLASAILVAIPGPSVFFVVGRSLTLGRRGGLLSVLGNTLGLLPHLIAVAVGVGALVAASAPLLTVIKLAGAGYLIYLGVQAVRHRGVGADPLEQSEPSRRHLLGQGFLVGVSNPKAMVFLVAVLPQFVSPDGGAVGLQMLILGGLFALIALLGDSVWAVLAGTVRDSFVKAPRRLTHLRGAGGVMMVGLGGGLALSAVGAVSDPS